MNPRIEESIRNSCIHSILCSLIQRLSFPHPVLAHRFVRSDFEAILANLLRVPRAVVETKVRALPVGRPLPPRQPTFSYSLSVELYSLLLIFFNNCFSVEISIEKNCRKM